MRTFQSTSSSRSSTREHHAGAVRKGYFNPRAPHGARRAGVHGWLRVSQNFNPRAPHGARRQYISEVFGRCIDFNPRAPHGARQLLDNCSKLVFPFQSTSSSRSSTLLADAVMDAGFSFQSTSSSRSSTADCMCQRSRQEDFNPRAPHGARRYFQVCRFLETSISIHELLTELDHNLLPLSTLWCISIHELLTELDVGLNGS